MPHRVTTIKRYRISNDVLILILEKLDPVSLYRTCQTFERVYVLVMEFQHLRYRFELGIVGMKDGPVSYTSRPPMMRVQLLMSYKKDWPRLKWTDEQKIRVSLVSSNVEVSGNFLYYAGNQSLDLLELPSCRLGRLPAQTRHIHYMTTPEPESIAVDALQSLIVAAHTIGAPNGQISLRLRIRNLSNFDKHPKALSPHYDCPTHIAQPVTNVSTALCGTRVVCTIEFGGLVKHLLIDWTTFQAMWLEEQDVIFLSAYQLLGVRKIHGKMALYLYNIYDMRNVFIEREYELPPIWAKSTMRFGRNAAEITDLPRASPALFYCDPSARVLVLTAKQNGPNGPSVHWMMINESFFRPTTTDRRSAPWSFWSQFCLIKEHSPAVLSGEPHVIGNRVVYLEKDGTRSASGAERTRLKIIDFAPFLEVPPASPKTWTHIGKYSALKPGEYYRDFPPTTTNGLVVENICATEDNVILSLEPHGGIRPVNVLTFGPNPPVTKAIRHDIQYHPAL